MVTDIIGYIEPGQEKRHYKEPATGEIFYLLKCAFKGITMDILVSSYVYEENTGCVMITGSYYTIQDYDETGKLVHMPCIYAQNISSLTDERELTNEVAFKFRLSKIHKYLVTRDGVEILFVYGTVLNSFGGIEVYKVCLKGALARKYKNSAKGVEFTARAYIKPYGRGVEFLVSEITE